MATKNFADFKAAHHPLAEASAIHDVYGGSIEKGKTRFIVTAAQNATPVHVNFWRALLHAAAQYDAQLIVIPLRYKNPTSAWTGSQENKEYWSPEVREFLMNQRLRINKHLSVLGDIKIVPTASSPLTGLEGFTGMESTIVGHTRLQFKTVPTPGASMAKLMTTTGACTVKNYTDSRAGKAGDFHHTLGAVLVEVEGGAFWLRHLNADSRGGFTDLDKRFTPKGMFSAPPPAAIALGDTHVEFTDKSVDIATFGPNGIVTELAPKRIFWHDLCDGYSANPHHYGNPFNAIAKQRSGLNSVKREVDNAIQFLRERTPTGTESIVVASNHDDFVRRWIIDADWKTDPTNAEFYLRSALAMVESTKMGKGGTEYPSPFTYWVNRAAIPGVRCLGADESYSVHDIEMGMHGNIGPNGARGSIKNLRRIGTKSMIAHGHGPGIDEGCTQIGTSSRLRLEYNAAGPSNWLHTHGLVHADGKRQLVTMINGRHRR